MLHLLPPPPPPSQRSLIFGAAKALNAAQSAVQVLMRCWVQTLVVPAVCLVAAANPIIHFERENRHGVAQFHPMWTRRSRFVSSLVFLIYSCTAGWYFWNIINRLLVLLLLFPLLLFVHKSLFDPSCKRSVFIWKKQKENWANQCLGTRLASTRLVVPPWISDILLCDSTDPGSFFQIP